LAEILLETNKGIVFEKTVTKNRCKVNVKNKDSDHIHMTYRFKKGVVPLSSPFISWENLNCCGGWCYDESYLLSAVQDGTKLCAGIHFRTQEELDDYKSALSDKYVYYCRPPMVNGSRTVFYIDVAREGAVHDFISPDDVMNVYSLLGIKNFNNKLLSEFLALPLYDCVSSKTFDYGSPRSPEEFILTGLMLGYPLETTAWLIEKHKMIATK